MTSSASLKPEQVQLFRHNGFLKLPDTLPDETVDKLKEAIWHDIRQEVGPVKHNPDGHVSRISNIWDRDPVFREVMAGPAVLDSLEALLGPNIELIKNRHNHATLRRAQDPAGTLHRDVLQWSRTIVTVLFYLEESTVENGCTQIIPGSHWLSGGPADRLGFSAEEAYAGDGILDQVVSVPMPTGGMLAIDSSVIHGVGQNRTNGTRMSMTVGYHSVDEIRMGEDPNRILVRGERLYKGHDY